MRWIGPQNGRAVKAECVASAQLEIQGWGIAKFLGLDLMIQMVVPRVKI
jgi:hypothetical protein